VSKRPRKKPDDALDFNRFQQQVKTGRIETLYLFTGEEDYRHDRALELLYKTVDEAARSFNVAVFAGTGEGAAFCGPPAAPAIDAANMLPMMASRRIVVIRDFDRIKDGEVDLVIEYLKRPAPRTTVVFQSPYPDKRRRITTAALKSCTIVAMDRLGDYEAARWVESYLKDRKCTIERGAVERLIARAGTQMRRLSNEMNKLATHAGGGMINSAAVEELVPRSREHTSLELWNAIIARDSKRALRLAHRLMDDGNDSVAIVGSLAGLYRRMLLGKEMLTRGSDSDEVSRATGQFGSRGGPFNARLRNTTREEIVHGIRRIARADDAIKNSEATPRLQIDYLVAELTLPDAASWGILNRR
jgi:DNA polymerase-3 subunit delta